MAKFRIHAEYPVYVGGGCIPYTIYFVTLDSNGKCSPYWDTEVEEGQFYITESDIENLPKED